MQHREALTLLLLSKIKNNQYDKKEIVVIADVVKEQLNFFKDFLEDKEIEVETETTRGIASPRAWGQVITITVTIRDKAKTNSLRAIPSHTASVINPALIAIMVNQSAARSARPCVLDLLSCAWRTSSVICARYDS